MGSYTNLLTYFPPFLFDNFAAFFADAGIFAVYVFMPDARGLVAGGTNELNFANVKGHFLSNDTALRNLEARLAVTFNFVDAFDDDFAGFGHCGNNLALFTFIFAGEDDDRVALLDVKFNQ